MRIGDVKVMEIEKKAFEKKVNDDVVKQWVKEEKIVSPDDIWDICESGKGFAELFDEIHIQKLAFAKTLSRDYFIIKLIDGENKNE